MNGGRPLRVNLLSSDYEIVAEAITYHLTYRHGPHQCFVDPMGDVRLRPTRHLHRGIPLPQTDWIGTYTKATPIDDVESDLINRLKELSQPRAA